MGKARLPKAGKKENARRAWWQERGSEKEGRWGIEVLAGGRCGVTGIRQMGRGWGQVGGGQRKG